MSESERMRALYGADGWLFPRQVAELCGVTVDTVNNLRKAGAFTCRNVATRTSSRPTWRYEKASVLAWLKSRTVNAAAA